MKKTAAPSRVRTSSVLATAVRLAVIVLAYQHLILPKQGALPQGTERSLWWSVKNAFKMSRWWVRYGAAHQRSVRRRAKAAARS